MAPADRLGASAIFKLEGALVSNSGPHGLQLLVFSPLWHDDTVLSNSCPSLLSDSF